MTNDTNDATGPEGLTDEEQTAKDVSYSPSSDEETAKKQDDPLPGTIDDDIARDQIVTTPGTGGPDDVGEIDVDPDDLNLPQDTGAH